MGKGAQYRKPKKKAYFRKKDWIALAAFVGVLAVAAAVFFIVANNDGYVKQNSGVYQIERDEIAANYGTDTDKKYKVIGTVGAIEGFALEDRSKNSLIKYLSPTGEGNVKSANLGGSSWQYGALADNMSGVVADQYGITAPAPVAATIAGRSAAYITYVMPGTADTGTDKVDDSTPDAPVAMAYLDYDEGHCAFIEIVFSGEMPKTDEIMALFEKIAGGISFKGVK